MTFVDYVLTVHQKWIPSQRLGQHHFNVLYDVHPDLAIRVRQDTEFDPFYDDEKLGAFLTFVGDHWDDWGDR